jgi:hypothetical protein
VSEQRLQQICDLIQEDVGNRGLRTEPHSNLITATTGDFQAACRSLAETANAVVAIVTGFYIPEAQPPCGETDGPLGALFLARALIQLGIRTILATDNFCISALRVGLRECRLDGSVGLANLPTPSQSLGMSANDYWRAFLERVGPIPPPLTHLIGLERVGPSYSPGSLRERHVAKAAAFLREVPCYSYDRCHTMRGQDVTPFVSPAHLLFEAATEQKSSIVTIGIGDGGNEVGMGKIPWDVIRRNIPNGGLVACRVPTDHLIVSGVSNWGAYGLAAGVALLRGQKLGPDLFDMECERELLHTMVEQGPLVDGVTGQATATVDGLTFDRYAQPLRQIGELLRGLAT